MTSPPPSTLTRALLVVWLLNLYRRARRTRPEPLPPVPTGSREVLCADGTRLHAQVGGRAEADVTVLFVHGLLARTIEWDMQWVGLERRARLVRYDHRNHGRSTRTRSRISIDVLADDLAAVVEQLVPHGRILLVGHSLGGMTALVFARRHPELFRRRVAGLCLIATRAGHYLDGHPYENTVRWVSRRGLLTPGLHLLRLLAPVLERFRPRRTRLARVLTRRFLFGAGDADPATIAMVQQLLEEPPLSVLSTLDKSVLQHDAVDVLRDLDHIPVQVISGDSDHLSWAGHAEHIAADIGENVTRTVIPGVGHAVNQTRPSEVNDKLHELLDHLEVAASA